MATIKPVMVKYSRNPPRRMKAELIREAGDKCANPGCPNYRTETHHIKEWAIYRTHDKKHMIAICPSCHDEVHHGRLGISDETLLRWKNMSRVLQPHRDQLLTGPASRLELLIGGVRVVALDASLHVFELLNFSSLRVQVVDGDLTILDMEMRDLLGNVVAKMRSNNLTVRRVPDLDYTRRNGRMFLTAPAVHPYVHPWALHSIRAHIPNYAQDGRFSLLDLEVFDSKTIRIEGAWMSNEYGIVATSNQISLLRPTTPAPISICTEQPDTSRFVTRGFVSEAFFNQLFAMPRG